jgi:hypothetical protein
MFTRRADARIGDAVEAAVRAKHRRRLERLGWARALSPTGSGPWAQGEPAPRPGNAIDVLILNDSEMNVVTDDAGLARRTRVRLWAEHLELDETLVDAADTSTLVDQRWRPIAGEQLSRRRGDQPPTHHLLALPGVSRRSGRLLGPLQGLLEDT